MVSNLVQSNHCHIHIVENKLGPCTFCIEEVGECAQLDYWQIAICNKFTYLTFYDLHRSFAVKVSADLRVKIILPDKLLLNY